jgi:hypothetical protein
MVFEIIFFIITLIILGIGIKLWISANQIEVTKNAAQDQLDKDFQETRQAYIDFCNKKTKIEEEVRKEKKELEEFYNNEKNKISEQIKIYKENTSYASEQYLEDLELEYVKAETAYQNKIDKLNTEIKQTNNELQKLKDTLAASIQARVREKEIQDNLSFYCLQISDVDKLDITRLEQVKKTLSKPRVLSMLIWQTWFQKPLKALTANIIGTKTITGIYKITNVETGECYIGQARDIASRWSEHAKCGLGIDTPANNKLYQAMQEYGLWSFSWELLEECPIEQLNEKEKYYISLYDSYNYGYNSNKGVGK